MRICTWSLIVDAIAIADVQAAFAAISPNRELHEPRKRSRETRIEFAGIDCGSKPLDQIRAAVRPIASNTVSMIGSSLRQYAGAMQKVVHERIDHDEARADVAPDLSPGAGAEQQRRHRHGGDLA